MKQVFVLAPLVAALVAALPAQAAGSYDYDKKHEASSSRDKESSAEVSLAILASQAQSELLDRTTGAYLRRVFHLGWPVDELIYERLRGGAEQYREQRLAELRTGKTESAKWAVKTLTSCDAECVQAFAELEILMQMIAHTHTAHQPRFTTVRFQGMVDRPDQSFDTAYLPATLSHIGAALALETLLMQRLSPGAKSFAARRAEILSIVFNAVRSDRSFFQRLIQSSDRAWLIEYQAGKGFTLQTESGHVVTASGEGLTLLGDGVVLLNREKLNGTTVKLTEKATASAKSTGTTTTESINVRK